MLLACAMLSCLVQLLVIVDNIMCCALADSWPDSDSQWGGSSKGAKFVFDTRFSSVLSCNQVRQVPPLLTYNLFFYWARCVWVNIYCLAFLKSNQGPNFFLSWYSYLVQQLAPANMRPSVASPFSMYKTVCLSIFFVDVCSLHRIFKGLQKAQ